MRRLVSCLGQVMQVYQEALVGGVVEPSVVLYDARSYEGQKMGEALGLGRTESGWLAVAVERDRLARVVGQAGPGLAADMRALEGEVHVLVLEGERAEHLVVGKGLLS